MKISIHLPRFLPFFCFSFILKFPDFLLISVSFALKKFPLAFYFKTCLLVTNSQRFPFFEIAFILPSFL